MNARHMYNSWRAVGWSWLSLSKSYSEPVSRFLSVLCYYLLVWYSIVFSVLHWRGYVSFHNFGLISSLQGIFISSSGDQSHSMSGNGKSLLDLIVLKYKSYLVVRILVRKKRRYQSNKFSVVWLVGFTGEKWKERRPLSIQEVGESGLPRL